MGRNRDSQFNTTLVQNQISFYEYYNRLCEMALSCFNWLNLPETIDQRFIELSLLKNGSAIFFEDETIGYLCLMCVLGGDLDVYGIPKSRKAYSYSNYNRDLDNKNSVIIFNNKLHTNLTIDLIDFARRLYELDRTIDINVKAQKTPVLLTGDEKQILGLKNIYKKYDGNEPVIYGDKHQLTSNPMAVLKTDAPFVAPQLYELKTQIWNEALTYLGITNVTAQKKERLITDEVNRSLGGVLLNRQIRLSERKLACERINNMFGLNIDVEFVGDALTDNSNADVGGGYNE